MLQRAVLLFVPVGAFVTTRPQRTEVVVYGGRAATPLGRATTRVGKEKRVQIVKDDIEASTLVFAFRGDGLDMKLMDDLRKRLPETAKASMVKNKLFQRAGRELGFDEETVGAKTELFSMPNIWIFTDEDMKGPINAYEDWIKENGLKEKGYDVRGGFMENKQIDDQAVLATVDLPTKPELMARLAGAINMAGAQGLATNIKNAKGNPQGLAVRLKQAAGTKLARAIKLSVADPEKNLLG